MQGGQVSIWVPIVVGVIGVLGIVAGQLINAWREDKRWRREQEQEDLRWQRERRREEVRLSQENALHWREMRVRIYGEAVALLGRTSRTLKQMRVEASDKKRAELYDEMWSHQERLEELIYQIQLVGSEEIRGVVQKYTFYLNFVPESLLNDAEEIDRRSHYLQDLSTRTRSYRGDLLAAARKELGITDRSIEDADSSPHTTGR